MASFYADENFPLPVTQFLRTFGHDILTVEEAGNARLGISDESVLAIATTSNRAVLTLNRRHYIRLHLLNPEHCGIVACRDDQNFERLATRIHEAISAEESLTGKLIRVNRPQT